MGKAKVYVKFPKAGLGNMMLTWSRAYVFSQLNDLEMHTSSWTRVHWGALARRERKKRFYLGYFKKAGLFKKIRFWYYNQTREKITEPLVAPMVTNKKQLFIFDKIFTDKDFFKEVKPHKTIVKKGLMDMLQPALKDQYNNYKKPVIGMHIRRGDFKRASTITPVSFFIDVAKGLRKEAGTDLPVTIFTDAAPSELEDLLKLNNVALAEPKPDILDILLLAASEIVVLSVSSTFSFWGAFLSEGKIIKSDVEWHAPLRAPDDAGYAREIVWNPEKNIQTCN